VSYIEEVVKIFKKIHAFSLILFFILYFLSINCATVLSEEQKSNSLSLSSLRDTIEIAYKNNKDIQIQEYGLKIADANILGARSIFLPNVDFNAGYTHTDAVLNSTNAANAKKDTRIFTGYRDDNAAGVSVDYTVYNGGANIAGLREAQLGLKEQKETLRATKLNVELDAKRLYYGLLLAYETKRIAQDLVQQAESHYEEVNKNFQHMRFVNCCYFFWII